MSFQQSVAACPTLADLWARMAAGKRSTSYRWPGRGTVPVAVGDLRRAVKEGRGGRSVDVLSCLAYAPGATHGICSAQDPWPAIRSWQRSLGQPARGLSRVSRPGRPSSALGSYGAVRRRAHHPALRATSCLVGPHLPGGVAEAGILLRRQQVAVSWVDALALRDGSRILEVGCGAGMAAVELAKRGHHVYALDGARRAHP